MKRNQMVKKLYEMVVNAETAREIWDAFSVCGDWNSEHYEDGEEIFMQECEDGVAIEDDFVPVNWDEM